MSHRISAGAIIFCDDEVLLVNHVKAGVYDFWVAPGGGVIGDESLEAAAIREVKEECGLDAAIGRLAYIEELLQPEYRQCKFWFAAELLGGEIETSQIEATREHIVGARFFSRDELADADAEVMVFPRELRDRVWLDRREGFAAPVMLPLRKLEFW